MKRLARIFGVAAVLAALPACSDYQMGIGGKLAFYDQTDTAHNSASRIRPIAAGAIIQLEVWDGPSQDWARLSSVTSKQPGVLAVKTFSGDLVTLDAGKPGTARITAKTAAGTEDSVDLDVEKVASDRLDLFPPEDTPFGFVMTPGAEVGFQLVHLDSWGSELTGVGAEPISATPASALEPQPGSDGFRLLAPSTAGTSVNLHAGKLRWSLNVVDPAGVDSIDLARAYLAIGSGTAKPPNPPFDSSFTESFTSSALTHQAAADLFEVGAHLADGRYVYGECSDFAFSPAAGASDYLNIPADSGPPGRTFVLEFTKFGTASFSVTCFGKTKTYTVTIKQAT